MNADTIQIAMVGVVGTVVILNALAPVFRRALSRGGADKGATVQVNQHQGDATNTGRHVAVAATPETITPRECEAKHAGIEHRVGALEESVTSMRGDIQSTRSIAQQILGKVSK